MDVVVNRSEYFFFLNLLAWYVSHPFIYVSVRFSHERHCLRCASTLLCSGQFSDCCTPLNLQPLSDDMKSVADKSLILTPAWRRGGGGLELSRRLTQTLIELTESCGNWLQVSFSNTSAVSSCSGWNFRQSCGHFNVKQKAESFHCWSRFICFNITVNLGFPVGNQSWGTSQDIF